LVDALEVRHAWAKGAEERPGERETRRRRKSLLGQLGKRPRLAAQTSVRGVKVR
jgi:hypothetical protein